MKVHILRGVPGSGKSHYARSIESIFSYSVVVSADKFFEHNRTYGFDASKLPEAHDACIREFVVACTNHIRVGVRRVENIIVDNTNLTVAEIATYYAVASAFGHEVEIVNMICDPEVAFRRQVHMVPRHSFDRMVGSFRGIIPPPWWKFVDLHT